MNEQAEFIHKLTFARYEKKQKVFQLPSLFVSLTLALREYSQS